MTPVFFILVLGMAEIGLAMNDYLAVAASVRAGARVASASGADWSADYGILKAVQRESAALPKNQIQYIVVYKPAAFGDKPTSTCQQGTPVTGVCNVYTPADFSSPKTDFGCLTTQTLDKYWCPTTRKVSLNSGGTEYVGVWMKVNHPWLTNMFGSSKTLTDSSVIRLEPRTK